MYSSEMNVSLFIYGLGWVILPMTCALMNLTSFPSTATEGEPFTLMCTSSNNIGNLAIAWFVNGDQVFTTQMCKLTVSDNYKFNKDLRLNGRYEVSCNPNQHNMTISRSEYLDGMRLKCHDQYRDDTSNEITIRIRTTKSYKPSSSIYNGLTSTSGAKASVVRQKSKKTLSVNRGEDNNMIVYIIAGSVCGAAVVIVLATVFLCYRRKRQHNSTPDETGKNHDTSHLTKNFTTDDADILVMGDNVLYAGTSTVHRQDDVARGIKPLQPPEPPVTNVEDLYAKPYKPAKHQDVYAEVKKVKKDICNLCPDGTNIEDLYAKPNKRGQAKQD